MPTSLHFVKPVCTRINAQGENEKKEAPFIIEIPNPFKLWHQTSKCSLFCATRRQ
eukprot:m.456375 g.456375  ORF g.456375 m.456375 type:complete len:55 (-) comp56973_c2_seq2:471-635(-)